MKWNCPRRLFIIIDFNVEGITFAISFIKFQMYLYLCHCTLQINECEEKKNLTNCENFVKMIIQFSKLNKFIPSCLLSTFIGTFY